MTDKKVIADVILEAAPDDAVYALIAVCEGRWTPHQAYIYVRDGFRPEDSLDNWWEYKNKYDHGNPKDWAWENKDEDIG